MTSLTAAMISCAKSISKVSNAKEELTLIIQTYQKELVMLGVEEVPMPKIIIQEPDSKELRKYSIIFGIKTIAEERLKQLKKGHSLESDLKHNDLQDYIFGAMYCLTLDTYWYPKKWNPSTMEKVLGMSEWDRVKTAGAFLSSYLDVTKYEEEIKKENEKISQGLMPQIDAPYTNYEELTLDNLEQIFSEINNMSRQMLRVTQVDSSNYVSGQPRVLPEDDPHRDTLEPENYDTEPAIDQYDEEGSDDGPMTDGHDSESLYS